ncbi:uncharacterized protein LOC133896387 [Phragmites australis]|uniref:uncharacterized protein LOC133896387 n=1 Tax=Phragmites australis TaxID=29695 RepID=UPI002D772644|nr:uncharacterized protein LOC133896387 [Phragmites australis]
MGHIDFPNMTNVQGIRANTVKVAVKSIIHFLEGTRVPNQVIYFDGWQGVGASAVLKSIAEHPPPSLRNKFEKIIHIDCSRWKSRRALQRTIAQELCLPRHVMDIFDRQDEDDDFRGVDGGSRVEISDVAREIYDALQGQSCLVVFHNGSNSTIDLSDFGISLFPSDRWSKVLRKVLWTFRGRLRAIPGMKEKAWGRRLIAKSVENSPIYLYSRHHHKDWTEQIYEEAADIARYTHKLGVATDLEIASACCRYLLSLNSKGGDIPDFNWATHASNYWVCDGILQEHQQDKAWEVAAALHEEIRLEDFSFDIIGFNNFADTERWIVATYSDREGTIPTIEPKTTSFFLADKRGHDHHQASLPNNIFQGSEQLHVLKLCHCTFNFSSPPFLHCQYLRFLGLDSCKDQTKKLEENKEEEGEEENARRKMEFFPNLWVLDVCDTDWELDLSPYIVERMAINIREINIKRGRIWRNNHAWIWRHLQNIHKLRVIAPTCPWETGNMDEFRDMVKLELLDLKGNSTIQVLPSLSDSTGLSTLILDGCVGLEHVGPDALPLSLETFSFDVGARKDHEKEAKISRISMAGCTRLVNFRLRGYLPNLEELDLSNTSVKALDLKDKVVQVPRLQRLILLGCERLRAIHWPEEEGIDTLMVLCIDTRGGGGEVVCQEREEYSRARVAVTDMRFLQSVATKTPRWRFCWNSDRIRNVNLCLSCAKSDDGQNNDKMNRYSTRQLVRPPLHRSLIPKTLCTYSDVNIDKATIDHDGSSALQPEPLDVHVEIGEGISNTNVVTKQGIEAVRSFMSMAKSLLVHDNSSITTVIPESMIATRWDQFTWPNLKWCRVDRCPRMETVFVAIYDVFYWFIQLETFCAVDLLMARSIWSKGRTVSSGDTSSFAKLRAIHLHSCPRLTFVLPLSGFTLPSLETLHIIYCGDLSQVFPVEAPFLNKLSTDHRRGVLEFPKLKHLHMLELPKLQHICEAKMYAPKLETILVRGCWSLKRLPATADRPDSRPVVDCEKDWWEKLEWDGLEAVHHPSLFRPRHSKYYKKTLLRGSVLR